MAGGVVITNSNDATLEFSSDGSTYVVLPYIGDISASGGEAPESDVVTFQGVGKITGHLRVPSISIAIPSYVPNLAAWTDLQDAAQDGDAVNWRITTKEDPFYTASGATNTAAIAITGVVTFVGNTPDFTAPDYDAGLVIEVGSNKYTIDSITSAGVVTVKPAPSTAVAATQSWEILNPSRRLGPFIATIRSVGNFDLPAEGALSTTLELTPRAALSGWTIV